MFTLSDPPGFKFVDPGPLMDRELELVPPQPRWVDELLNACRHPMMQKHAPAESKVMREDVQRLLEMAPLGREPGDSSRNRAPAYHFWMMLRHGPRGPLERPALRIAGGLNLRVGSTDEINLYYGNVGYHVYPAARGYGYAERSCRLLLPLARRHGMRRLWITCNPENLASRRTCEKLGASMVDIVDVPEASPLFARGETRKCRYLLEL